MRVASCWFLIVIEFIIIAIAITTTDARRINEQPSTSERELQSSVEELIPVIIGYQNGWTRLKILARMSDFLGNKFNQVNAYTAMVTRSKYEELMNDPDVLYVEQDAMVYPYGETVQYGLDLVQAESTIIPKNARSSASCKDPNSFKIGIIDSGLAVNHPDISCTNIQSSDTNCIGDEFGLEDGDGLWYNPAKKYHGTHVAGTIGATDTNQDGIKGVISDGEFCFVIARVFGEAGGGAKMSDIFAAVQWMVSKGTHIINMSLGGETKNSAGDDIMKAAYNAGTLLVAAAGNGGGTAYHYPATYNYVMSVAAVDANLEKASFSQYNDEVDIAAPGDAILSTYPLNLGSALFISSPSTGAAGIFMERIKSKPSTISGVLVDCGFGENICSGNGGHICLMKRGNIKFEEKVLNCEKSGGIAAIVSNNEPGTINAGVAEGTATTIPALEVTQADGARLKKAVGESLLIKERQGYNYLSGTSMSVPHVVGVAGKIWRACPSCTNKNVESCLYSTAVDLGDPGKDNEFGWGLVQAEAAYKCLVEEQQCCSYPDDTDTSPVTAPTPAPETGSGSGSDGSGSGSGSGSNPSTGWQGRGEDLIVIMYKLLKIHASYIAGEIGSLLDLLFDLVDENVEYNTFFEPANAEIRPLFESISGIENLVSIFDLEKKYSVISEGKPKDIATGNGVVYYQQTMTGSLLPGGPEISWDTVTQLSFNEDGQIVEILRKVIDPQVINSAYPADV